MPGQPCISSEEALVQWCFACLSCRKVAEEMLLASLCTLVLIAIWCSAGDKRCALTTCRLFESGTAAGGIVKALCIPNGKAISNARIKTKGDVASRAGSPFWKLDCLSAQQHIKSSAWCCSMTCNAPSLVAKHLAQTQLIGATVKARGQCLLAFAPIAFVTHICQQMQHSWLVQ